MLVGGSGEKSSDFLWPALPQEAAEGAGGSRNAERAAELRAAARPAQQSR